MDEGAPPAFEALARVPLFATCSDEELKAVATAARQVRVRAGAAIVKEGDPGNSLFVIVAGQVRVVSDAATEKLLLARLGAGEFFGELALLSGGPRSAAVMAERDSVLLEIGREAVSGLAGANRALEQRLETVVTARRAATHELMLNEATVVAVESGPITIGRDPSNVVFVNEPGVRARHAEITASAAAWRLRSIGDMPDTYLNNEGVAEARLSEGDEVRIGGVRLFVHEGMIRRFHAARGIRLEAAGVGRIVAGGRQLLRDVDLAIRPGELVAIVGPSGAGKTTLLNTLLGLARPSTGAVYYDGLRLAEHEQLFRPALGYVPQQDILHDELTVRQALWFVGRLRLPPDTTREELARRVEAVLEQVSLADRADVQVRQLSGGQRKRASIAGELLSEPRMFFLDEPTSGLDPGLDEQMMRKFRELADEGRTMVVTTHATRNIELCDRVVVLSGGETAFVGAPREAMSYFGVDDFSEVYRPLAEGDAGEQARAFRASHAYRANVGECLTTPIDGRQTAAPARARARPQARSNAARGLTRLARQWLYLARRDLRVTLADRLTLVVRLFGAPTVAASLLLTFDREIFAETLAEGGNARAALTLLYLSAVVSLFLGGFTASNAITRESAIFRRERMVGLSPLSYVLAKVTVLGAFSLLQGFALIGVLALGIDFPAPRVEVLLKLGAALSLTSLAGMGLGLLVSSLSPNADRAAILVVLLIIPQLIFAGSTVPRSEMSGPALLTSDAMVSKWSVELLGGTVNLDRLLATQSYLEVSPVAGGPRVAVQAPDRPFEEAFRGNLAVRWLMLAGFAAVFVLGTLAVQARKGVGGR